MKNASSGLISLLGSSKNFIIADLWKITLKNGTVLYYTSWDQNLTVGGHTYKASDVVINGGKLRQTRGLEVNETEVMCYPNLTNAPSTINSIPFLQACRAGLLDRATIERSRLFMPTVGDVSLGAVRIFLGEISDIETTRNYAQLKCKDAINLLNIYLPRRQYQATCPWTFGESNCQFNVASVTTTSTAATGSTQNQIFCSLSNPAGYYNFGNVTFTSGLNNGVSRSIKSYAVGNILLNGSFPQPISAGDTFSIAPGCSKNLAQASQTFYGSANTGSTAGVIYVNFTNAAGFFNNATLQFTSGANVGQAITIQTWTTGAAVMSSNFPNAPAAGDTFVVITPVQYYFPVTGATVVSGNSTTNIYTNNIGNSPGIGPGIVFTSGVDNGQYVNVSGYSPSTGYTNINPSLPLPYIPAVGDTFSCIGTWGGGGSITNANTNNYILSTLGWNPLYTGANLTFTSGLNNGTTVTVVSFDGTGITIGSSLAYVPAPGDTFTVSPSQGSGIGNCSNYNNTANFGGFPYVPFPETAY